MKLTLTQCLVSAALLGAAVAPVMAQSPTSMHKHPMGVNARLGNQERRIEQGERSGSLTPREAGRLQHREYSLRRQDYRAHKSGGKFTYAERKRLEHEENRSSSAIYKQKHDAQHRR
jgi:hypothetical protein